MFFKRSLLLAAFVVSVLPAAAQTPPDSTVALDEVVVVDSVAAEESRSAVRATRIYVAGSSDLSGRTAADLLESESFLFIRRNGAGGLATASLRGAGAGHTLVVFDGLRMADPQTGQVDLTTLPSTFVESVTIGHGAAYVGSGKSALGGTVEVQPVRPRADPSLRLTGSAGPWGERQLGFALSQPLGSVRSLVAFDRSSLDGAFPLSDADGRYAPERREGAQRSARNLYVRTEVRAVGASWFAATWLGSTERGVPGPANAPPVSARQSERTERFWAGMERSIRGGRLNATVAYTGSRLRYDDAGTPTVSHMRTRSLELNVDGTQVLSRAIMATYSGEGSYSQSALGGGYGEWSGDAHVGLSASRGRLTIQPNLGLKTYVASSTRHTVALPSVSALLDAFGSEGLLLRASFGRTLRPPTFNDRFWLPGGNPDLSAERGWSADAGFRLDRRFGHASWTLDANVFWSRLTNKIAWHPSLAGSTVQTWRAGNVGRVRGSGLELSTSIRLALHKRVTAGTSLIYTHSRIEDRTDPLARSFARQLRYVPEDVLKARLSLDIGATGADAMLNLTGQRFVTSDESQALRPISDLALRIRGRLSVPGGHLRISASLENALNTDLETIRYYPMPPRHVRVALAFESGPIR
jgi:iron complex outermembrane receptor protein